MSGRNWKRLLIISNRLPVSIESKVNNYEFKQNVGGLATALGSFYRKYNSLWVGWPGSVDKKDKKTLTGMFGGLNCKPIFIEDELAEGYYNGFANRTLWPLLHSLPMYTSYSLKDFNAYKKVNMKFCNDIIHEINDEDIVWIHDYHLMLLPRYIREKKPNVRIGFFLHTPFPDHEVFRLLPWHKELINGILGADLIGFHNYDYVNAFLRAVRFSTGVINEIDSIRFDGREIRTRAFPIGIETKDFGEDRHGVTEQMNEIRRRYKGMKMVFSISRLDYTKGIQNQLESIDKLIEKHKELSGKIVYVLTVVPSREDIEFYKTLKRRIESLVSAINEKHGTEKWKPIEYTYGKLRFSKLLAFYRSAHVLLALPIRDGMNLIAKEYLASRRDNTGTVVISDTAGAAKEFAEAFIVSSNDLKSIVEALYSALRMRKEEQIKGNLEIKSRLKRNDVRYWAETFMKDLTKTQRKSRTIEMKGYEIGRMVKRYNNAKKRLVLLDFDGTLVKIDYEHEDVKPSAKVIKILRNLVEDNRNSVVLISGRSAQFLEKTFGNMNMMLVAEHGSVYRSTSGKWIQMVKTRQRWRDIVTDMLEHYTLRLKGSFIEQKGNTVAWNYGEADQKNATDIANEVTGILTDFLANSELGVLKGKRVIEVRNNNASKNAFYLSKLEGNGYDFIAAFGDDITDEDMLDSVGKENYSIHVGPEPTKARYSVTSYKQVLSLLKRLTEGN